MKFIPITSEASELANFRKSDTVNQVVNSVLQMYDICGGLHPFPWLGFLCVNGESVLGTCAFKSQPKNNQVEIAYFVFPEYEGKGLGTLFAAFLVAQAKLTNPDISILAETLPESNASTSILGKLHFKQVREYIHPEDGKVWQWLRK